VRPVCTLGVGVVLGAALGCAGSRTGSLQPRTRDADALRAAAASTPLAPEPWVQLALLERERGQADAALAALQQALRRAPDDIPALTLVAKLFHECGRSADGLRYFASRPLAAWPEPVQLDLAVLLADAGAIEPARAALEGLRQGSLAEAAAANLAWLDLLAGKPVTVPDAAAATLEAENNRAVALLRAGRVDESEAILRELVRREPHFAPARANLGLLLRHWRCDAEAAERVESESQEPVTVTLSDAAVDAFLQNTEDAAPPSAAPSDAKHGGTPPNAGAGNGSN
jgi:tetratricopeptide (TPR) repeat protein